MPCSLPSMQCPRLCWYSLSYQSSSFTPLVSIGSPCCWSDSIALTKIFEIALWSFFSVVSWRWRDGKDGGVTITTFTYRELNQVTLFCFEWRGQPQFKILSLVQNEKNKVKMRQGKGWTPLADFCTWFKKLTFYNWVEELESRDQHHFYPVFPWSRLFLS